MNTNKIDFIICYNDDLYMQECMRYISRLHVPEGIETEVIGIAEADSMAAGYNAGMQESNAKYKVYMHQDVFILNRDFIGDVIALFKEHPEYGMLGVIGSTEKVMHADYWCRWNVGVTYAETDMEARIVKGAEVDGKQGVVPVIAIDGMLMITQYDVSWREDVFDAFVFYDISQSVEFYKAGYKVGVVHQNEVWCNHGCGSSQLQKYDVYREKFCKEYAAEGYVFEPDAYNENCRVGSLQSTKVIDFICDQIDQGNMEQAKSIVEKMDNIGMYDKRIGMLYKIFEIIRIEQERGIKHFIFKSGMSSTELFDTFKRYMFFVRRVENGFSDYKQDEEWKELLSREGIIVDIPIIAKGACLKPEETIPKLMKELHSMMSEDSLTEEKERPLVSVVMPSYNHAKYVGKAIESVLGQTYTNIEFIIVDDASSDESVEIIKQYNDSRITFVALKENTGFGAAEKGYEMATGKYIATLASDDMWKPNLLEKTVEFLEKNEECLCCFSVPELIDENDVPICDENTEQVFQTQNRTKEQWFKRLYKEGNCLCAPSVCMRREVLEKLGIMRFQYRQLQDYEYWLRVVQIGNIYVYPEKLMYYRKHSEGGNANISAPTKEVLIRDAMERKYIMWDIMEHMEDEFFIQAFKDEFVLQPSDEGFCLDCEKFVAMLNSTVATVHAAIFFYFSHYKDELFRYHLENYYQIQRKHIWDLTGVEADRNYLAYMEQAKEQKLMQIINELREELERTKNTIQC